MTGARDVKPWQTSCPPSARPTSAGAVTTAPSSAMSATTWPPPLPVSASRPARDTDVQTRLEGSLYKFNTLSSAAHHHTRTVVHIVTHTHRQARQTGHTDRQVTHTDR